MTKQQISKWKNTINTFDEVDTYLSSDERPNVKWFYTQLIGLAGFSLLRKWVKMNGWIK